MGLAILALKIRSPMKTWPLGTNSRIVPNATLTPVNTIQPKGIVHRTFRLHVEASHKYIEIQGREK